jgi:hypothetical protein
MYYAMRGSHGDKTIDIPCLYSVLWRCVGLQVDTDVSEQHSPTWDFQVLTVTSMKTRTFWDINYKT